MAVEKFGGKIGAKYSKKYQRETIDEQGRIGPKSWGFSADYRQN